MPLIDLIELVTDAQDLFSVNCDVCGLADVPAGRLVYHHGGVWEAVSFPGVAATEEEGAH